MTEQNQQNSLLGQIAAYTEILSKDPKSTIFVSLSEAYRKMGMLDDARLVIEHGLANHDDFSPAHIVLARILCQQGDYVGSESSFKSALQYDPESLAALVGYTRLNILLGRDKKARDLLLVAREISPADPIINKLLLSLPEKKLAEFEDQVVEDEEAIDEEQKSEAKPVSSLASTTLAELYLKQGLPRQALEMYRHLSLDEPDNFLLRRKIRDLEGGQLGLEAADENTTDDIPASANVAEKPDEKKLNSRIILTASPEENQSTEQEGSAAVQGSELQLQHNDETSVLSLLDRWLDSIQQRRDNV